MKFNLLLIVLFYTVLILKVLTGFWWREKEYPQAPLKSDDI